MERVIAGLLLRSIAAVTRGSYYCECLLYFEIVPKARGCKSEKALGNTAQTSSLRSFGVASVKCIYMLIAGRKRKREFPVETGGEAAGRKEETLLCKCGLKNEAPLVLLSYLNEEVARYPYAFMAKEERHLDGPSNCNENQNG